MIYVVTILVLSLIIFIHELGHFLTAKWFKMPVSEFSIGMGPLLYKKNKNGTQYSIRAIPVGGYVMIDGMSEVSKEDKEFKDKTDEEIEEYNKNGFSRHPKYQKLIVLLAGVFMNFVSAIIVYLIYYMIVKEPSIINAFVVAISMFNTIFMATLKALLDLIIGASSPKNLVGIVGLPKVVGTVVSENGYKVLIPIFSSLSINIGIANLLPIPALDGGRVIFVLLEYFGIKIDKKLEEKIHTVGMILLLLLMVYVIFNDVRRLTGRL